jgi:hypothetical protein
MKMEEPKEEEKGVSPNKCHRIPTDKGQIFSTSTGTTKCTLCAPLIR